VFDELVVPESRNIPRDTLNNFAAIDFAQPHLPLLFIAGEKDHIVPNKLARENFEAYTHSGSKKEFVEFAGRTHYIIGQPGWEEVAGHALYWIQHNID